MLKKTYTKQHSDNEFTDPNIDLLSDYLSEFYFIKLLHIRYEYPRKGRAGLALPGHALSQANLQVTTDQQ